MDITFVLISLIIFLAIVLLLLFLFKSSNKKSFKADDGSLFESESDLNTYQALYEKTKPIFSDTYDKSSSQEILGFQKSFLTKLTRDGFQDLKALVQYRKDIKLLSDLINN